MVKWENICQVVHCASCSGWGTAELKDGERVNKHSEWQPFEHEKLMQLRKEHKDWSYQQLADKLTELYGTLFTFNAVRNRIRRNKHEIRELPDYKSTIEICKDGSQISDTLVEMSKEDSKDTAYLLKAHGYDDSWEIINAKSSIWNQHNKQDGTLTLFASKITVKPKKQSFFPQLLESIKQTKPITIKINPIEIQDKRLLEIPLFDPHFGISDYDYYKPTQTKILNLLFQQWEEVIFILGQDMLHNDNFKGQTANGTLIETVDMAKAWENARRFYEPLIEKAIKQSNSVKVIYSKGNHDESMSWAFVQMLKAKYPQIQFDDSFQERKVHTFNKVFIGITHGDKARKNLHNIFPVEFPIEWSQAKTRELHTGHYHVEDGKDVFGMMVRTLATRNKTDQWHKDNGFVGAHKRFMLFEYSEEELESIHYV